MALSWLGKSRLSYGNCLFLGTSPQTPGIYRIGAIRILLSDAGAVCLKTTPSCVLAPESALGLLPSVALSSAQVDSNLTSPCSCHRALLVAQQTLGSGWAMGAVG